MGFSARDIDLFGAGAVYSSSLACPAGFHSAFLAADPSTVGCYPDLPESAFEGPGLGDVATNFLIGAATDFLTGGLSVLGQTAQLGTSAVLTQFDAANVGTTSAAVGAAATILGGNMDEFGNLIDDFSDFSFSDLLPSSDTFSGFTDVLSQFAPAVNIGLQALAPRPGLPAPRGGVPAPRMPGAPGAGALGMLGIRSWAFKFPNLWQAVQTLYANFRVRFTPEKLWGLLNKFGIAYMIALIGDAALRELILYKGSRKRRRMNVANTRALRRSLRRMKGFNRLAHRVSAQLGRAGARRAARRCSVCRKSPCCC